MAWNKEIFRNPWQAFAPFLLLYVLIVLAFQDWALDGDAGRYITYARNLLAGHYSPREEVYIWNGPGYPLLLCPFVATGSPVLVMILLNALFRYLSVVFLYKAIARYSSWVVAFSFSLFWALHYTTYKFLPNINTESLAMLLASLLAYFTGRAFEEGQGRKANRHLILAGLVLGFLVLAKAAFGYVLLFLILVTAIWYLASRKKEKAGKMAILLLAAFILNLPYLGYTYHLTGRPFYWANSGGMSLYWMSTPYENEYGDWQSYLFSEGFKGRNTEAIRNNHEADYAEIFRLKGVERDDLFRKKAIENIRKHPKKYLVNCVANINRLLFGFPNSYQYENLKFLRMLPNIFILSLIAYSLVVTLLNLRHIPAEILFLVLLVFVYLGLSTLVSAYPRMFLVVVPVLLLWIAYVAGRTISLKLFFTPEDDTA